jgi:hypothetical protein
MIIFAKEKSDTIVDIITGKNTVVTLVDTYRHITPSYGSTFLKVIMYEFFPTVGHWFVWVTASGIFGNSFLEGLAGPLPKTFDYYYPILRSLHPFLNDIEGTVRFEDPYYGGYSLDKKCYLYSIRTGSYSDHRFVTKVRSSDDKLKYINPSCKNWETLIREYDLYDLSASSSEEHIFRQKFSEEVLFSIPTNFKHPNRKCTECKNCESCKDWEQNYVSPHALLLNEYLAAYCGSFVWEADNVRRF